MRVRWVKGKLLLFRMRAVTPKAAQREEKPLIFIRIIGLNMKSRKRRVRETLIDWMLENPGFAVIIGGPGSREDSSALRGMVLRHKRLPFGRGNDPCIVASFAHAVYLYRGDLEAKRALGVYMQHWVVGTSLAANSDLFKLPRHGLTTRKLTKKNEPHLFEFDAYDESEARILLVRLRGHDSLDHVVCVDMARGIIYDNEMDFPLRCTSVVMSLCAGGLRKGSIREVRQVVADRKRGRE